MNCRCTIAAFTLSLEPVGFAILCWLAPGTGPYMRFLFVDSQLCARASSGQHLTVLPLPSASSYHHLMKNHQSQCRLSYRGLAPHKFMPMLGVHKQMQPTPASQGFVATLLVAIAIG